MGLQVEVYKNIKKTTDKDNYDFQAHVIDEEWEWKIKNLEKGALYTGDCVDRSISYPYSSHMEFRINLIRLIDRTDLLMEDGTIVWYALPHNIPFYDFIYFADNEGCLDFEVSGKIYNDFKQWESEAELKLKAYDLVTYLKWLNVFDLARNNGVVVFS